MSEANTTTGESTLGFIEQLITSEALLGAVAAIVVMLLGKGVLELKKLVSKTPTKFDDKLLEDVESRIKEIMEEDENEKSSK